MREAHKSKLGQHLKDKVGFLDPSAPNMDGVVMDGGWFLHQIKWEMGNSFSDIAQSYTDYLKHLNQGRACNIVFDGYHSSPKDHEHKRRSKNCVDGRQIILDPNNSINHAQCLRISL